MKRNRFLALVCTVVLGAATLGFAQKKTQNDIDVQRDQTYAQTTAQPDHMAMHHQMMADLKVGKTGDLHITTPATIGNITLQPGDYEVQHVSSSDGHFIEFTRYGWEQVLLQGGDIGPTWQPQFKRELVASVNCEMEPLNAKAKRTTLMASADRKINGLEIRGENVEHVF